MPTSVRKRIDDLVRICESSTWSRVPEAVSQKMVDTLAEVLDCDLAFVHLLDITGDHLIRYIGFGEIPGHLTREQRFSITTGRMLWMMKTHKPIIMDFFHPDPADQIPKGSTFRSAISVPLLASEEMLGMFSVVYKTHQNWSEEDLDYLLSIGRLLGVSVQHAQTARKAADLEILIERKRLCAELHDNLSQLIGSLNLNSEAAFLSFVEGNTGRLRNDLERIRCIAQEANLTLREEMLSLRTTTNESGGLVPGIREHIKRFEQQWGIETDLQVIDGLEPLIVSTQVELQFMRILQESLMNILRHATASHVSVLLQGDRDRLCMQIHDNGRGFDPEAVSYERLGLQIMHERAESLGGELTISSGSGTGTTVRIDLPIHARSGSSCA